MGRGPCGIRARNPRLLRLARHHLDERSAADSVWLLASYPFAIYFSAPYTEGPFLLASCSVFLAMHERRFGSAAFWGLVAGLIRPNGWLLAIPIVVLAFDRQAWPTTVRERLRRVMPVAAPVAGVLLFTLYLYIEFGDGLVWIKGQAAWGRAYRGLHLLPQIGFCTSATRASCAISSINRSTS